MSTDREPTDEEIVAHARVHARDVVDEEFDVDLARVEWTVSNRTRRRAGACRWNRRSKTATIVLSRGAYCAYDRDGFEAIVRHELIHAWEFQQFGESGHGSRFREWAARLEVPRHCESFSTPRYRLQCTDCEWSAKRHRASKPIRAPDGYRCGVCGGDYEVEHTESGRTWASASGYGGVKAALGEEW